MVRRGDGGMESGGAFKIVGVQRIKQGLFDKMGNRKADTMISHIHYNNSFTVWRGRQQG